MRSLNRGWKRSNNKQSLRRRESAQTEIEFSGNHKPLADWMLQEYRVEQAIPGGKKVQGSGCSSRHTKKGDVKGDEWLGEAKTTGGKSLSVKRYWLGKIRGEAEAVGKKPLLTFGFDEQKNLPREDWMAFEYRHAKLLMEIYGAVASNELERAQHLAKILGSR